MPNAFDELGSTEPYVPNYLQDDIQFRIDNDLRTIAIPSDGVVLGVVGDKNVNHVNFQMPAWYNGFDMSTFQARINFIDAGGNTNYYNVTDMTVMTPEGVEVTGSPGENDIVYFTWLVDSYATGYVGQVRFNVRLTKFDTNTTPATLLQAFNTQVNSCQVLEGIQLADEITQEQAEDLLFHYSSDLGDLTEGYKRDIEKKAAAALLSIPDDYTTLGNIVTNCIQGVEIISDASVARICNSNANNIPNNRIYPVGLTTAATNFPYAKGIIITHGLKSNEVHAGDFQIFVGESGVVKSRLYWGSSWTSWKILTNEDYVKNREKVYMLGAETNISDSNVQSICDNDFNKVPNNRIYGMGLVNATVSNIPSKVGTLLTFGKQESRTNGDVQIHINDGGVIRTRRYWSNTWTAWKIDVNEDYVANREKFYLVGANVNINDGNADSICQSDFNKLPNNRIYGVGLTNATVANAPYKLGNVRTYGKQEARSSGDVQIFTTNGGITLTRIYWGTSWTSWSSESGNDIRVLALGDSICAGHRNNQKGFIGDVGVAYDNIGISGATLSTTVTDVKNIPQQLVDYTATELPDAIVCNGGVNDYYFSAPLGTLPTTAVKTQSAANALDKTTVLGGLQFLFWTMISKFPKAQRFFLCTHKTTARASASSTSSNVVDWTTTKNSQNYTQTEEFEAIKAVCKLYNVTVIDVFNESQINSGYSGYVSSVPYSEDSSVTNREFVDADGIHPLAYGYLHGYAPLVKKALDKVSKK